MTHDKIIQLAREAELAEPRDDASTLPADYVAALTRFAQLVASHKQEQCAKVCEKEADAWPYPSHGNAAAKQCAAAIRSRKGEE